MSNQPLLDRLRRYGDSEPKARGGRVLCLEAADEIERLIGIICSRGQHPEVCAFYGECHCELKEFEP